MIKKTALIIIDVQNDFCSGGAMEVYEADKIIPVINNIAPRFYKVIATQNWHPVDHVSFARTHNKKPYEIMIKNGVEYELWPAHCVEDSRGAELHWNLDIRNIDMIIRKGRETDMDSYSIFLESDLNTETGLHYYLKGLDIKDVYLCGLATDYCVYYSALDSITYGFNTYVILDASKGINIPEGNIKKAVDDMQLKGVKIINHESIQF